jgi:hypothetical protein
MTTSRLTWTSADNDDERGAVTVVPDVRPDDECSQCGGDLKNPAEHCPDSGVCAALCDCPEECSQCGGDLNNPAEHCPDSGDCVALCDCPEHTDNDGDDE